MPDKGLMFYRPMYWNSSVIYTLKKYLEVNQNSIYTYYKNIG